MTEARSPEWIDDPYVVADRLIERLSGRVLLALPLGLGKPVQLTNALYQRARQLPEIELTIRTALTLEVPKPRSDLEARFMVPLVERLYAGVPQLDYVADLRRGSLPDNVRIEEFYFRPGSFLGVLQAQQSYTSTNYTHAARDLLARGVNVIAHMVAPDPDGATFSLSCNPDVTLDVLDAAKARGEPAPLLVGELNPQLPFMPHDAVVAASHFELMLDPAGGDYSLFPVPNRAVSLEDHAIALRVAGLIKDGGTLQIGIGALGDAVTWALMLRRNRNDVYRALLEALGVDGDEPHLDNFSQGIYAESEMFVEGFLHLRESGVLRRTVEDDIFLHAAFYLGSARFYERLRTLADEERRGINMTRVSYTNSLLGDEAIKRAQRRDARFVNTAMMVTLTGAAVSDGLDNGQVVSGVGGQYNFVAMAHELEGARSIIAVPATRLSKGSVSSNIVWNYGHITIPRHLRDLVVTQYGVADLRGATDADVIAALLNVADSRFQEALRETAVAAGKLPKDHRIPERYRNNRPEVLARTLTSTSTPDAVPFYPLGTDLTDVEAELAVALEALSARQGSIRNLLDLAWRGRRAVRDPRLGLALERMALTHPRGAKQRIYQALLAAALQVHVHDSGRPLSGSA